MLVKAGWILIGCRSVGKKIVLKVLPTILFLCAFIVIVVVRLDSAVLLYFE